MNRTVLAVGVAVVALIGTAVFWTTRDTGPSVTMEDAEAAYARGDIPTVVTLLTELAEAGEPLALYRLGLMHREGDGVEQSRDQAIDYLDAAAQAGESSAEEPVRILLRQRALAGDPEDGVVDLTRAARYGDVEAQAVLGSYYLTGTYVDADTTRAVDLLTAAAEAGDARAQTNLGAAYATGQGVTRNDEEAFRWYLAAAEQGMVRAQPAVGLFYEQGRGVEQNLGEAVRWYLQAYNGGAPGVDVRLGVLLAAGAVTGADPIVAADWADAAVRAGQSDALAYLETQAEAGDHEAMARLAFLYKDGEGIPQDGARALTLFQQAAEAGAGRAQLEMARRHAAGEGVELDYIQAHVWANLAAAAGIDGAAEERNVIAQFLSPDDLETAQGLASAWRDQRRGG